MGCNSLGIMDAGPAKQIQPVRGTLNNRTKLPAQGYFFKFYQEWLVLLDVPLNIYAIIVRVHTETVGVIFGDKIDPPQPDPCLHSPNLKNINLPTPKHHARASFSSCRWFSYLTSFIYCIKYCGLYPSC